MAETVNAKYVISMLCDRLSPSLTGVNGSVIFTVVFLVCQ